jgi:hypothetical protein
MYRVLKLFSFRAFLLSVVIISSGYCSATSFLTVCGLYIINAALAYGDDHDSSTPVTPSRSMSSSVIFPSRSMSSSVISPSRSMSSSVISPSSSISSAASSAYSPSSAFNSSYSPSSSSSAFNSSYSPSSISSAYPVYPSQSLVIPTNTSNSGAGSLFIDPKMAAVAIGAGFIFADQAVDGVKAIAGATINGAKGLYATVVGSDDD